MKKIISIVLCFILIFSMTTSVFANTESKSELVATQNADINPIIINPDPDGSHVDNYYLIDGKCIAWEPNDEAVQPVQYGIIYQKVVYLTKFEAAMVAEGYRDSVFQNEMAQVLDYCYRAGSYAGAFLSATAIVQAATKLGCTRVVSFFSGVGGAVLVGFVVDDFLNMVRYVDYNNFRSAIEQTTDGYWVQIKVGYANAGTISQPILTPVNEYRAWNTSFAEGISGFYGTWTNNIQFNTY